MSQVLPAKCTGMIARVRGRDRDVDGDGRPAGVRQEFPDIMTRTSNDPPHCNMPSDSISSCSCLLTCYALETNPKRRNLQAIPLRERHKWAPSFSTLF
jgi:hypothetical protein